MTVEELHRIGAELPLGTEVVVEFLATGAEIRGPFAGVSDDYLMLQQGHGVSGIPADQIGALLLEDVTQGPE